MLFYSLSISKLLFLLGKLKIIIFEMKILFFNLFLRQNKRKIKIFFLYFKNHVKILINELKCNFKIIL